MADANTVIANLGQQVAQLTVDKAILEAELAELRAARDEDQTVTLAVLDDAPAEPVEA